MTTPRAFLLDVGLFEPRCGSVQYSEQIILDLLAILVRVNERVLECGRIRPLYEYGARGEVQYMGDEDSRFWSTLSLGGRLIKKEIFMAIPAILRDGGADCEDLAAWRVAELRAQGEKARDERDQFHVLKMQKPSGELLYHVQVQRLVPSASGKWYRGDIEDPSAILGMGSQADVRRRMRRSA